jgi:hypothetical protein
MYRWLLLALALHAIPATAQPTVSLYCARGAADYPDAEMSISGASDHVVNVVFVGFRPSRGRAEWSLRDCLSTAAKLDGSRNIVAALWYRDRDRRALEVIEPFGPARRLVYRASSKQLVVEREQALYSLNLTYSLGSSVSGSSFSPVGTR